MIRLMLFRFVAGLCLCLVLPATGTTDDNLVRLVRDGHRAARESIRTLSATVTIEEMLPKRGVREQGRYWRSGTTAHLQQGREGGHTHDALMKGGEIRIVGRTWAAGKQTPTGTALRQPSTASFGICDAWGEMLIELNGPDGAQLDLDRILGGK